MEYQSLNVECLADAFVVVGKNKDSFVESYVDARDIKGVQTAFLIVFECLENDTKSLEMAECLVETFRKYFYRESVLDIYSRFEEALKYVNDVAREFQSGGVSLFQLNVAIAVLQNDVLYIAQSNDAEVYLCRKGALTTVSEGLTAGKRKEHSDLFENIATGQLERGDVVLLSSSRLLRYVPQSDLARHFVNQSQFSENLIDLQEIVSNDILGQIGVLGFKLKSSMKSLEDISSMAEELTKMGFVPKAIFYIKRVFGELLTVLNEFRMFVYRFLAGKRTLPQKIQHKKIVYGLGGLFLVLFFLFAVATSGLFGKSETILVLEEVEEIVSQAKSEQDRERQAQLLSNAEGKLVDIKVKRSLEKRLVEIRTDVNSLKSQIDNLVVIKEMPVYADIASKRSDVELMGIFKVLNNYFAIDVVRTFEFIGDLVKDPILVREGANIVAATPFLDMDSLVFLTADGKIREYFGGIVKFMETDDEVFKPASEIVTYGSRLYLLDNENGQIWRYSRKRDSYGKAEPALANIDQDKVKEAVSLAIDGSVYLLYKNGAIEKYFAGSKVMDFAFNSRPISQISEADYIWTEVNFPFVLVMESSSKKIYQFFKDNKSGNLDYVRHYYFEDLAKLTGFMVDYGNRRLLVTDGKVVYNTPFLN